MEELLGNDMVKFLSQKLLLQFLPMPEKLRPRTRWPDQGRRDHRRTMQMVKNIRQRGRHDWKPSAVSFTEILVDQNKQPWASKTARLRGGVGVMFCPEC